MLGLVNIQAEAASGMVIIRPTNVGRGEAALLLPPSFGTRLVFRFVSL